MLREDSAVGKTHEKCKKCGGLLWTTHWYTPSTGDKRCTCNDPGFVRTDGYYEDDIWYLNYFGQ